MDDDRGQHRIFANNNICVIFANICEYLCNNCELIKLYFSSYIKERGEIQVNFNEHKSISRRGESK